MSLRADAFETRLFDVTQSSRACHLAVLGCKYGSRAFASETEETVKSSNEPRERRNDAIPMVIAAAPHAAPRSLASPKTTRVVSLLALAGLAAGVIAVGRGAFFAITDAWVAPAQLSPESREVVAHRMEAAKQREQRARLEGELTSASAELVAIDLSLGRLQALQEGYAKALRWTSDDRDDQLGALIGQKVLLERQRELTAEAIDRDRNVVERAKKNLEAGVITATELEAAQESLARTQLSRGEKELEYLRVNAALEEASRASTALAGSGGQPTSTGRRGARHASPDVMRLDEVRINVELQVARLGAEKRGAEARERAARAAIESMDELAVQLEATPLFLAARREIDLAFVPYAHLRSVRVGDGVYTCRWLLFGCREAGRIKRIFPGEVVTDDPWGSVARGHYVQLEMSDRTAMAERTLRVRHWLAAAGVSSAVN
jgi:hypothetical protein